MDIIQHLKEMVNDQASDIIIVAEKPLSYKVSGGIRSMGEKLLPKDTEDMVQQIYNLASRSISNLESRLDDDFSFSLANLGRFRVNTFFQRGTMAAVLKVVLFQIPNPDFIGIPSQVMDLHKKTKGLILVTGPTGCGKTTSLACLIDKINREREAHVITLEDPLEYLHKHKKGIVSQREVFLDTPSYEQGLRAALREAPDVILLGEMRDLETISAAMSAAETGQMVFSTLHTLGAANTIDRIVDVFPSSQQRQVRIQLSMVLQAVISQQLIPSTSGGMVPAFELMLCTPAIRNVIRESKVQQIDSIIYAMAGQGMLSMDSSIFNLYTQGLISQENALTYSVDYESMKKKLNL